MTVFTKEIRDILRAYEDKYETKVTQIPKNRSSINIGDVVLFRYQLGSGRGSRDYRIVLVVKPVVAQPKTGNLLLTGVRVGLPIEIDPSTLYDLYNNRGLLPEDNYRTYRLNKIHGPLFRIATKGQE